MNHQPSRPNSAGLAALRAALWRDRSRANAAFGIILGGVLALAIAAVFADMPAEKAEATNCDRLWNPYVAHQIGGTINPTL